MNKISHINNLDIFSDIPPEEIMSMCQNVKDQTYQTKLLLYVPNEMVEDIHLVKSGEILLYRIINDRKIIIDILSAGDMFGNFSIQPSASTHFAEITPGTRVCTFPVHDFLQVIANRPEVMLKTLGILSNKIKQYESKIAICPAPAKDKVLQELAKHLDKPSAGRITHQRIANLTGLNRVTVTRALQDLTQDGKIGHNQESGNIEILV